MVSLRKSAMGKQYGSVQAGKTVVDVVVANPPYVRQESLSPADQIVFESAFSELLSITLNISAIGHWADLLILH